MSEVEATTKVVDEKEMNGEKKSEVTEEKTEKKEESVQEEKDENSEESKEEFSKEDVEKALQLIAQGKRNVLCGEVQDAVNQFQEATRILAGKYGETANECGEAYLCYGRALLDLSRQESGVLGNALTGLEDEESQESDVDKITDEESATATEGEESEDINTEEEGDAEAEDGEGSDDKKKESEEEEDVSNLQLAWEVLELAKNIFSRDASKENKLKLAEAYLKLGEVALETEQYESAVGDIKECLTIQQSVLDADDRLLAETFYQLGVANSLAFQYENAVESFTSAKTTMEARINALEKVIGEGQEGKEITDVEDPVYKAQKEVKELREILPDIVTKIEDIIEEQKTAEVSKAQVKAAVCGDSEPEKAEIGTASSSSTDAPAPANVITHLVRKKRKPDSDEVPDVKKQKVENGDAKKVENGSSEENGSGESKEENGAGDAPGKAANGTNGTSSPEKKDAPADMETEEVKVKTVEDVKKAAEQTEAS